MKQLWQILMDKLKLVDPIAALIAIGVVGMFTIGMMTKIIVEFFFMVIQIILAVKGQPLG